MSPFSPAFSIARARYWIIKGMVNSGSCCKLKESGPIDQALLYCLCYLPLAPVMHSNTSALIAEVETVPRQSEGQIPDPNPVKRL